MLMDVGKWLEMATWLKLAKQALLPVSTVLCQVADTKLEIPIADPVPLL